MIGAYLTELERALKGPRAVKEDLLAEARDSLVDAAHAYQNQGLDRDAAERQAVAEFGEVRQIAPAYQAELGLAQGRRTALLVFFLHTAQHFASEYIWRSNAYDWTWRPRPGYLLLADLVDWASIATMVGSLLAAFACGAGVRYLGVRRRLTQGIGVLALAGFGFFAVAGLLLTVLNPDARSLVTTGPTLVWTVASGVLPLWVVVSARRCLSAA